MELWRSDSNPQFLARIKYKCQVMGILLSYLCLRCLDFHLIMLDRLSIKAFTTIVTFIHANGVLYLSFDPWSKLSKYLMGGLFPSSNSDVWFLSILEILLFLFDLIVFCRFFFSLQLLGVAKEVGTQHHNCRRVTVNNYLRVLYNFASFKIRIHQL